MWWFSGESRVRKLLQGKEEVIGKYKKYKKQKERLLLLAFKMNHTNEISNKHTFTSIICD
jgi:hypothetical protein